MKVNLYAVFDSASAMYDGPIPGKADGHIIRHFSDQAINPDTPIGAHPEDFALVKIGTWDDSKGELVDLQNITMMTGLEAVANARQVKEGSLVEFDKEVSFGGTN